MDIVASGREAPRPHVPAAVPFIAVGLLLLGLVAATEVRQGRTLELRVVSAAPGAEPAAAGEVQDAVVDVTVHNSGRFGVLVLDQRLDRGGPVDRGPVRAVAGGTAVVLAARWQVRCAEVGTLFGPRSLDLTVRPARGAARGLHLPLRPAVRQAFRAAASDACAP